MRVIFETAFDLGYLVTILALGVLILRSAPAMSGNLAARLAGWLALVLGFGDSFHLLARIWALNTTGIEAHFLSLAYGKLITALTMTAFYVLVYLLALELWPTEREQRARATHSLLGPNPMLGALIYGAAIIHVLLVLLPQNQTFTPHPPLTWGIIRNVPFVILGLAIIALLWQRARTDPHYRFAWLAVVLSFGFYIPVVLWAHQNEAVGLLMIPKTMAYVWLVVMGYRRFAR